ncbi:Low-density lipoprotein receptor domain class A, partial [Opisthorchis viverrini]
MVPAFDVKGSVTVEWTAEMDPTNVHPTVLALEDVLQISLLARQESVLEVRNGVMAVKTVTMDRTNKDVFACASGECIDIRMRCNGRPECADGSDERGCGPSRCMINQFPCASGECIDARLQCNGQKDCYDESDEYGCTTRCRPDQFMCYSGECIASRQRCNGFRDCRDGSDETGC